MRGDYRSWRGAGDSESATGQTIAVFGIGGVRINLIAGGVLAGAERMIAVDIFDEQLEFARKFGATDVVNSVTLSPAEDICELTRGGSTSR